MRLHTLAFAAVFGLCLAQAQAQTIIYSNITTFSGQGYAPGGTAAVSGDDLTKTVADDITFAPNTVGAVVTSFTFSTANFNTAAVTARPIVSFYAVGSGGGPGSLLNAITFNPITFAAGTVNTFNAGTSTYFVVPSADSIWAAVTFDDNGGTTGATTAQLNLLGQALFNPPTVGSSTDVFFQSTNPGVQATSSPAGSFFFFNGAPVANFGWRFSAITPEPGSTALFVGMGLSGGIVFRRRKTSKNKK